MSFNFMAVVTMTFKEITLENLNLVPNDEAAPLSKDEGLSP